ncbi:MAG TPA: hypothetical protein VIJ18_19025, partial [Microbacteriaceae bacterium]
RLDAILTFHRRPLLIPASIGQNAGLIGAALKARDLLPGDPLPGDPLTGNLLTGDPLPGNPLPGDPLP